MELLKTWLPANIPPGDETRINHGDYRLGTRSSIRPSRGSSQCSTGSSRRSAIRWPTSATTA
jgi:hypothetical protein